MQFTAGLTGEAATLAAKYGDVLRRLPATVHAFILVELQKWPTLFGPEQRYQRALLEHLARLPGPELDQAAAGIARIETQAGANRLSDRNPARFQDEAQALLRKSELIVAWRKEVDAFFQKIDPALEAQLYPADAPRRLVVQIYGSGIAVQRERLWSRFKGAGLRVPLNLEGTNGTEPFLQALFGARAPGRSAAGALGRRDRVGAAGAARCLAHRIARGASRPVRRRRRDIGWCADRFELRPPARISRRSDARALHQDPEGRGESAGVCGVCAQPADCPTGRRAALLRRCPARLRARRAAHGERHAVRQQHVRRVGRGAGDPTRAAAHPGDPVRRARQVEAVQQPAALLATARVRPDSADRGSPRLVHRCRAVVVLRLAERGKEPGLPEQDALSVPGGRRRRDAGDPLGRAGRDGIGRWHRRASRTCARRWRSGWACPHRSSRGGPLVLWWREVVSR